MEALAERLGPQEPVKSQSKYFPDLLIHKKKIIYNTSQTDILFFLRLLGSGDVFITCK